MTCLVWDGKIFAADSQCSEGSAKSSVAKIFKHKDGYIGIFGNIAHSLAMRDWYLAGAVPDDFPHSSTESCTGNIVVILKDVIAEYNNYWRPIEYDVREPRAWGSGAAVASAGLYFDQDAISACEAACNLDLYCGFPVKHVEVNL